MSDLSLIRLAEKKDLVALVDLCEQHARFEKSEYSSTNKSALLEQYLFANPPALYALVVERGRQLIGYATYMKQFSTWDASYYIYMDCLFMTEAARGLGIGEQLVNKIKVEAVQLGCDLIQWQTPDFNKRAMKFYDRIGAKSKTKERYFLDVSS